jgi:hypothetical protein
MHISRMVDWKRKQPHRSPDLNQLFYIRNCVKPMMSKMKTGLDHMKGAATVIHDVVSPVFQVRTCTNRGMEFTVDFTNNIREVVHSFSLTCFVLLSNSKQLVNCATTSRTHCCNLLFHTLQTTVKS